MSATMLHHSQPSRPERSLKSQSPRSNVARSPATQKAPDCGGDLAKLQFQSDQSTDFLTEYVARCPSTGRAEVEKKQSSLVARSVVPTSSSRSKNVHIDERPANRARLATGPTTQHLDRVRRKNSEGGLSQPKVKEEKRAQPPQPRPTVTSESVTPLSKTSDPPKILDDGPQVSEPSDSTVWRPKRPPTAHNGKQGHFSVTQDSTYPCLLHDCCGYGGYTDCNERAKHMDEIFGGNEQVQCSECGKLVATNDAFEKHKENMCYARSRPLSIVPTSLWLKPQNVHRVKTPEPWDPLSDVIRKAKNKAKAMQKAGSQ